MNEEGFAWTGNENMTWTTNYTEFSLDPLKAKQKNQIVCDDVR